LNKKKENWLGNDMKRKCILIKDEKFRISCLIIENSNKSKN
jgi:hypothetical protein